MKIKEHLMSRGLSNFDHLFLNEEENIATFLLFNLSGQIVGYQQYNPEGTKQIRNDVKFRDKLKYFTYAGDEGDQNKGKKKIAVWGMHTLNLNSDVLFICEGIFDACKIHNEGHQAIAVLANDPQHLATQLAILNKKIIAICDHDSAGNKLAKFSKVSVTVPSPYHDLGEMPQEIVNTWIKDIINML